MQIEPDLVCELVKQNMGNPDWRFRAHDKEWTAPEISSFILKALAEDAAMQSGMAVERVVITVPAYFGVVRARGDDRRRQDGRPDVVDVINEPTAAAFSYGFAQASDVDETVLVYDLGGGTFDVTVIRLEPTGDGGSRIRVVATGGDDRLGGALWDTRMVQLLADKFQEQLPEAADPLDDEIASADLRLNAEDVKRALTARDSVSQVVMAGVDRASVKVTREEFEAATNDLLEQTIDFTRTTVAKAADAGAPTIDRVLLVGGSSFMPAVTRRLQEVFPDWTPELQDPNQAVAKGAALAGLQAALRSMIADAGGDASGAEAPTEEQIKEVAALAGISRTAAQAVLETEVTNVCSRAFGIKVIRDGGDPARDDDANFEVVHIIEPNTPLPIDGNDPDRVKTFGTAVDNQSEVQICVMEQTSREPTGDMAGNHQLEEGRVQDDARLPARHADLHRDRDGEQRHAEDPRGRQRRRRDALRGHLRGSGHVRRGAGREHEQGARDAARIGAGGAPVRSQDVSRRRPQALRGGLGRRRAGPLRALPARAVGQRRDRDRRAPVGGQGALGQAQRASALRPARAHAVGRARRG